MTKMNTVNSFKGLCELDPEEEKAFKRKNRKGLFILVISFAFLAAIIIALVVETVQSKNRKHDSPVTSTKNSQALEAVCSFTNYPKSCYFSISSMESSSNTSDPQKLFQLSLQVAFKAMKKLSGLSKKWMNETHEPFFKQAVSVCQIVFDEAIDALNDSISSMDDNNGDGILSVTKIDDLRTRLSTVLTDQETCLDALVETNATIIEHVKHLMKDPNEFASNGLAIASNILRLLGVSDFQIQSRKLMEFASNSEFPNWVGPKDRKLLQIDSPKPDVTVAQDGSGDVKTIGKAVKMAERRKSSSSRFVIYVKAGLYKEAVTIGKKLTNVMIYGDGKTKTIVSFDKSNTDKITTFYTATFAVDGNNFMARDIGFKNTAGALKNQAVALRSSSDFSVFYRCSFDGFQDTLYTHVNRQFYRECDITGTVDFIFGNAAVVIQDCNIMPRQPLPGQFVTITAQGKQDPNQNSGICIQNCVISPLDNVTAPVYLGRPWKDFATTVVMQSNIGGFLNPEGWSQWAPDLPAPDTIFYAEYMNMGAGANVKKRVKWAGYKPSLGVDQAAKFSVSSFIGGETWIPQTELQVSFTLD